MAAASSRSTALGVISVNDWGPKSLNLRPEGLRAGKGYGALGGSVSPLPSNSKLAQWGPGRSYGKMWFWCISGLEKSSNLDISQLIGRSQHLELCKI